MQEYYRIPIVLFVFRRLDSVKLLMNIIRETKPLKIYVFADGARENHENEAEQVNKVRDYISKAIDWKCESHIIFAKKNKGCAKNICDGMNYVFQKEKEAIIFEDDALPTHSFFRYAELLLNKYRDNRKIQYIAGYNAIGNQNIINESYTFSKNAPMSGAIATWADRWNECDFKMKNWPRNKKTKRFRKNYFSLELYHVTCAAMDDAYLDVNDGWDYQFRHDMLDKERYAIVPKCNLVRYQVYCEGAFHTLSSIQEKRLEEMMGKVGDKFFFPMEEPTEIVENADYDRLRQWYLLNANGNYFHRHMVYIYRHIKELAYKFLPRKMWNFIKKIIICN